MCSSSSNWKRLPERPMQSFLAQSSKLRSQTICMLLATIMSLRIPWRRRKGRS